MRSVFAIAVISVVAIGSAVPAFADQAQTDLQAVLQAQQQQQQQQLVAGLSGVQPYCSTYNSCPNIASPPPNFGQTTSAGTVGLGVIFPGLFAPASQAAPAAYPTGAAQEPTYSVRRHRHHRPHRTAE